MSQLNINSTHVLQILAFENPVFSLIEESSLPSIKESLNLVDRYTPSVSLDGKNNASNTDKERVQSIIEGLDNTNAAAQGSKRVSRLGRETVPNASINSCEFPPQIAGGILCGGSLNSPDISDTIKSNGNFPVRRFIAFNFFKRGKMTDVQEKLLPNGTPVSPQEKEKVEDKNGEVKINADSVEEGEERETWGKKVDFLLSVIGFAVDLGNVWRFPYICYRNGGGAFLVPYFLMLIFLGLPLFYLELALGQFHRSGAITIWAKICPLFTGVGYAICLVATYVGMYYNTIIAWAVYYTFASFRSEVPWARCNNEWNTNSCVSAVEGFNKSLITNSSTLAAAEYYLYSALEIKKSTGIDNLGGVKWSLCLCLLAVFIIVYFSMWKGIKSSGKAVWITATVPYLVLVILLIRGCTLDGALNGIKYYITPKWERLADPAVWIDAAAQIFFSLGPGFGTLLALSSYNKFHNNCYMDAMITASINCLTSLLAGFVVFTVLGYMAHIQGRDLDELAIEGPGLVFFVYPEAIGTLTGSVFWSIIFFIMLITLGLDSTYGGLESVITGVCDAFPRLRKKRELFVFAVIVYCFLGGIPTTTYGGQYLITLLDTHAAPVPLLFICFIEVIAVSWFYGVQKFSDDIEKMLGFQPGLYWKICWVAICPLFLLVLCILSVWAYRGLSIGTYIFPFWSEVIGWCITCSSIACIPAYIIYKFIVTKGSFKQVLCILSVWAYRGLSIGTYIFPFWSEVIGWCITCSSIACIPAYIIYKFIVTKGSFKQVLCILSVWAYRGLSIGTYIFPFWSEVIGWCITCSSIACIPAYIIYKFIVTKGSFKQVLCILSVWAYRGLSIGTYIFPFWSEVIGWCITCSSIACIPAYIIYKFIVTKGSFKQKVLTLIRPTHSDSSGVQNGLITIQSEEVFSSTNSEEIRLPVINGQTDHKEDTV